MSPTSNRYTDMYKADKEEPIKPEDIATPEQVHEILSSYISKGKKWYI